MKSVRAMVRDRGMRLAWSGLALAGLLLLGWMVSRLADASSELDGQRSQLSSQSTQIMALASGLSTTEQQLKSHGITPLAPPPAQLVAGPPGPQGATGPGPSDAQVQSAVDTYLVEHPPSGTAPTSAITAAVDAYLVANPPAPGPGPTTQQVSTAVSTYLAANPPATGPPGTTGAQGDVGPAGPQGAAGLNGGPGPAGAQGPDPAGWTWTDPATGTVYDCEEDGQTPAPHYACTAETSPSPTPTQTPATTPTEQVVSDRREHLAAA